MNARSANIAPPLIVCLPGALLDKHNFDGQFLNDQISWEKDTLTSAGFDCVHFNYAVPTRLGGKSFSVETAAEALTIFLRQYADRQIILFGHSLGGMIAQNALTHHQVDISHLILAETSYGAASNTQNKISVAIFRLILRLFKWKWYKNSVISHLGKHAQNTKAYLKNLWVGDQPPQNYQDILAAAVTWSGKEALTSINVPTLILVGSENKITHAQARFMQKHIPNAQLAFIPDAGHMVLTDNPAACNAKIISFLSGQNSKSKVRDQHNK